MYLSLSCSPGSTTPSYVTPQYWSLEWENTGFNLTEVPFHSDESNMVHTMVYETVPVGEYGILRIMRIENAALYRLFAATTKEYGEQCSKNSIIYAFHGSWYYNY